MIFLEHFEIMDYAIIIWMEVGGGGSKSNGGLKLNYGVGWGRS